MPLGAGRRVDGGPAVEEGVEGVLVVEDVAIVRELTLALSSCDVLSSALSRVSSAESRERTTKKTAARQTATANEPITAMIKNGEFELARGLVAAD